MNSLNLLPKNTGLTLISQPNYAFFQNTNSVKKQVLGKDYEHEIPEILFVTSYPPRECGIATYSNDLMNAIKSKFSQSFELKVCALETNNETFEYSHEVNYVINKTVKEEYFELAQKINQNKSIELVVIEHEFGFFVAQQQAFLSFLSLIKKPILIAFHTVLPLPSLDLKHMYNKY